MPIHKDKAASYALEWDALSLEIRAANGWQCQECGCACYRVDDWETHSLPRLTLSHYEHDYDSPAIFIAVLCAPCHLRHDAVDAWRIRRRRQLARQRQAGQLGLRLQP